MRLQAIKLAGFKSFVDPTTVPFPSNLCAVVGPNGCGKSNIIDAVRWVMGESSAKTLRGESMADVIFNGSNARKPVGQATIELMFDNAEGHLVGEYAAYSEISIRRQVTRDGQSNYYLNGQKCRRKDITSVFLGTGLGPRSYSIIEQGMISELIEARPEELRGYLEEAAGISRYKERRRETERRIRHARENLERLNDLREELGRQLSHLERQAKSAGRYKELRAEERRFKAELHGLRWNRLNGEIKLKDDEITRLSTEQEARVADQRRIDADIETQRAELAGLTDALDAVQQRYYQQGNRIAEIEGNIRHQNERSQQFITDLEQVTEAWHQLRTNLDNDQQALDRLREDLAAIEPQRAEMLSLEQTSGEQLLSVEQAMQGWQEEWELFNQSAAETRRAAGVQQSGIEHLEQSVARVNERVTSRRDDVTGLSGETVEEEIAPLQDMLVVQEGQLGRIEAEMSALTATIEQQREHNTHLMVSLDEQRSELQESKGQQASLVALQQAALGQQDDVEVGWLARHSLGERHRLAEQIQVEHGWELAVETVLGDRLQAVCVEGVDQVSALLADFDEGHLHFVAGVPDATDAAVNDAPGHRHAPSHETLGQRIRVGAELRPLLDEIMQGVRIAEDLAAATAIRPTLLRGESVITPDGIWIGTHWLQVSKSKDMSAGIIKRQEQLGRIADEIETMELKAVSLSEALESGMARLHQAESDRELQQTRLLEQQRSFGETRAELGAKQVQAEQIRNDLIRTNREIQEGVEQLQEDEQNLREVRQTLQVALDGMEADTHLRASLQTRRKDISEQLDLARAKAKTDKDAAHQLALRIQSLHSSQASTQQAMERLVEQERGEAARKQTLVNRIKESEEPQARLKADLATHLEQRLTVESELTSVRQGSEQAAHQIRELEQVRSGVDEQIETIRASLEQVRLARQEIKVRQTTIEEQLTTDREDLNSVLVRLAELAAAAGQGANPDEAAWEQHLSRIDKRVQRLGAINLAAIEEFNAQSERKEYLDAQNEDLEKALATLENAIRKIDVETRTRFKETFDKVNTKLQLLFPKLFGGGYAYLDMTGEDLLDTGVSIMARPPGKRNTSIHQLSGGEKALAAIALVFSIFSLNPAPFCLLDEVDAPLDDANVARYSDLVKEMSRTIQFIYITHNKIAMEMGEQLIGVTMQEAGVSRLVSVDVEEAVAMAAV